MASATDKERAMGASQVPKAVVKEPLHQRVRKNVAEVIDPEKQAMRDHVALMTGEPPVEPSTPWWVWLVIFVVYFVFNMFWAVRSRLFAGGGP